MAILKSFDLEGNKLSFANWISNLSPTCTPFSCMINKEKINQTQYSWQTDALAPATAESFQEGSQADSQPRAATKVITNFTTTLRRAVEVTDTNEATHAYGRSNEMKYQLTKAGKELLRDIEFANLSTEAGRIGAYDEPSRHSGFKALVAELNVPDQDTKAVVHMETPFMAGSRDSKLLKELFKVTTNLFIAGSKANKIMFHPKYMFLFNDYIAYNEEEPHIHRMFDGMDERYNAFISKVKDPLGRMYSLIPNRYMPEDEFYIFNESDWTQTILRAPQRVKIGKTGSNNRVMIETEIGLRHRHPYASGVLSVVTVNKTAEVIPDKTVLTAYTGDTCDVDLIVSDTLGNPVLNFDIAWESSDSEILEIIPAADATDDHGHANAQLVPHKPGHVTIRAVGDQMLSEPVGIEVVGPVVRMALDSEGMDLGERIHCSTTVQDADGTYAQDGTKVTFHANSGNVFFLTDPADTSSWVTEAETTGGVVDAYIACEAPGTYRIWNSVNGVISNRRTIYVGTAQLILDWVQQKSILEKDIDKAVPFEVVVKNKVGDRLHAGAKVSWSIDNPAIARLSTTETLTDAQGQASITIDPVALGSANLRVHCYGDEVILPIAVAPVILDTTIIPDVVPFTNPATTGTRLETFVEDSAGNPLVGATVVWSTTPSNLLELDSISGITDDTGFASTTAKGIRKGRGTLSARIDGTVSNTVKFSVGQDGQMTFSAAPNPAAVGEEITLSGTLLDQTLSLIHI